MPRVTFRRPKLLFASALGVLAWAWATPGHAASLFDPALRFRTVRTEHFIVYFHQGAQPIAMRLAPIAEETWRALAKPLGVTPPPMTHVVLADQTELANGYATPLPRDEIVIYTAWPGGADMLGATDDYLRVVFTHEFTHIVHLDRSKGYARGIRTVFGRSLFAFPNAFLPQWQIEGLAVFEESAVTGGGRLHAGDFRAIVGEAARERSLEPLDRINGGLTDWPGGGGAYAYGLGFHQYLANRFGDDSFGKLAESTAGQLPYAGSRSFKKVYGETLGDLWRAYEAKERETAAPEDVDDHVTRVTRDGFEAVGPRFDRFVCDGCPPNLLYVSTTPHGFPTMNRVAAGGGEPAPVIRRFLGSTTATGRRTIYFDQLEARRNVGLYGDLYALDRATGGVRELTREARLTAPDLSPDERTIVAVQDRVGARALVIVGLKADAAGSSTSPEVSAVETLVFEPETQFDAPRWSPDGRSIVVERHRVGGLSEIVVVDVGSRSVRIVASMAGARSTTPAWRPDGRAIVAAVAPRDRPFNLFEFDAVTRAARQLTHTTGGATWPDVSPDGKTIAFVGYTIDGSDIFTMPYPPASPALPAPPAPPAPPASRAAPALPAHDYSPLATMLPTSWSPIIDWNDDQVRLGAATAGVDVLGYHYYAASATWLASAPSNATPPNRAEPDWSVSYAYDRWRPTLFVTASSDTSFFAGPTSADGATATGTLRERQLEAGVVFPVQHTRIAHTALAALVRDWDAFTLLDRVVDRRRGALRLAWATATALTFGYSISPERGVTIGATAELARTALGSSSDATTLTLDARAYLPGLQPHHVVAVRVGGGTSTGDAASGRAFFLGGSGPNDTVIGFDSDALNLQRGFSANTFAGRRVALLNADYRFPIARPQRGAGTWPFLLHTVHGAGFVDAGYAWTNTFDASSVKTSVGGEFSADIVLGYYLPLTFTGGAAWGHDGGSSRGGATFYARVGRAF